MSHILNVYYDAHFSYTGLTRLADIFLAPRNFPIIRACTMHATNYLQNGLKVEGEPVPQRKLAGRGAGDEAPALRRPGQRENRASHLVGGRFDEARGHRIDRIVHVAGRRQHVGHINALGLQCSPISTVSLPHSTLSDERQNTQKLRHIFIALMRAIGRVDQRAPEMCPRNAPPKCAPCRGDIWHKRNPNLPQSRAQSTNYSRPFCA